MWINNSPFNKAKTHIKYLGLNICKTASTIYLLNYTVIINKVIAELISWKNLFLSLIGKCHLIKMVSFPKLLYAIQTLPCLLKTQRRRMTEQIIHRLHMERWETQDLTTKTVQTGVGRGSEIPRHTTVQSSISVKICY